MMTRATLKISLVACLFVNTQVFAQSNGAVRNDELPSATGPQSETQSAPTPQVKSPSNNELPNDLDGLFEKLGKTRNARLAKRISTRIWKEWQTSDSKSIDLLTKWARAASGQRRFGKALDLLDQVVVLRPDYAEAYNQRATLHYMMENFGKSITDIESTLALEPRHYGAMAGLAAIFERIDQKEKALATWYRVLTVYPAMKSAQDSVVRLEEELAGDGI